MLLIWEDGYVIQEKFGTKLCGVSRNRIRPSKILYTKTQIPEDWDEIKLKSYLLNLQIATINGGFVGTIE